jgi:hypothetical protein
MTVSNGIDAVVSGQWLMVCGHPPIKDEILQLPKSNANSETSHY